MFDTSLLNLNIPVNRAVCFSSRRCVYHQSCGGAGAVVELRKFCLKQQTAITGAAVDKEREGEKALQVAHKLGRALGNVVHDHADETNAARWIYRNPAGGACATNFGGHRPAGTKPGAGGRRRANATEANTYNINAAAIASVNKEVEEYAAVVSAPQQSIADRKALTQQMREPVQRGGTVVRGLDDMILQFGATAAGQALIASHKAARIVRDSGGGSGGRILRRRRPRAPPAQ